MSVDAEAPPQGRLGAALAESSAIDVLELRPGAVAATGRVFRDLFGGAAALMIADERTWSAAGEAVAASLSGAGIAARRQVLPAEPRVKPRQELGDTLAASVEDGEIPVAIGAGVINDLAKYAAYTRERGYLCVATAASMDGYTSAGSPLSQRGFKKTLQCRPPRAIIADTDILASAPREMLGWGYADMAGKVAAGADWIAADALGVEPIDAVAWPMVQQDLRFWLDRADGVGRAEPASVEALFAGLSLTGFAMEAHGSSRPASGADHQIAHLWEMQGLEAGGQSVSHGACVAIGCLTVLSLYRWLLQRGLAGLDPEAIVAAAPDLDAKRAEIEARLGGGEIAERSLEETRAKHLSPAAHRARLAELRAAWPRLSERLRAHLIAPEAMRTLLRRAGAPASAAQIGVDAERLAASTRAALYLRSRYTILDILAETGRLDAAIADICGAI